MSEVPKNNNQNQEPLPKTFNPYEIIPEDYDLWDPWSHSLGYMRLFGDDKPDVVDVVHEDDLGTDDT